MLNTQPSALQKKNLKQKTSKAFILITKQFDDGRDSSIVSANDFFIEYDIASRTESNSAYSLQISDNIIEYDILSRDFALTYCDPPLKDLDFQSEGYVEPFQESSNPVSKQENTSLAQSSPLEPPPGISLSEAGDQDDSSFSKTILADEEKGPDDMEFMADLKSILGGQMVYDPLSKKMIKKSALSGQKLEIASSAIPSKREDKDLKPLHQKNEHEIFDRIAQSMAYANAYDLGSVPLEKRFQDFDDLIEIQERKAKGKKIESVLSGMKAVDKIQGLSTGELSQDFKEDIDAIKRKGFLTAQSSAVPTNPLVVGRSIDVGSLQEGDLIIAATNERESIPLRTAVSREISYSSIYVGNGNVIEAALDGVQERSLESSLAKDAVAVAFRHINMTPENAQRVVNFLKGVSESRTRFDYWSLVRVDPYQIINNYCSSLPSSEQGYCREQARIFRLGTDMNNEFYCSELIFRALQAAGLRISDVEPNWSASQDVLRLNHNGTLLYIGHLKV